MNSHVPCLETMIPVTSFHMGWPNKHSITVYYYLLVSIECETDRGGGGELGDKDMGSEKQLSFFNWATVSFCALCSI